MAQHDCVYQWFKLEYHAESSTSSSSSDSHEDTKALFRIIIKEKRQALEQSVSGRLVVMAEEDIPAVENEFCIVYVYMCTPVLIEYMITRQAAASLINLSPLYKPMVLQHISTSTNELVELSMNGRPKHLYVDVNLDLTSYVCHSDEETLIQSALQNRYGSIHASRTSIEELKLKKFMKDESEDVCSICREEFLVDMEVAEMLCLHIYYKPCIVQWLKIKNECPLC